MNIMKTFDIFGTKLNFRINGRDEHKTIVGAISSLFNLIILGLIIYGLGDNFYKRINPKFLHQVINPIQHENFTITNKNFSFAYRIEDLNAELFDKPELINIKFVYYNYEIKDSSWSLIEEKVLDSRRCTKEDFGIKDLFLKLNLKNWFCPNLTNIEVGGNWDETYVKFFRIFVYSCEEGKTLDGYKCSSNAELKKVLNSRLYFSTFYQKYLIDPGNLELPFNTIYTTTFNTIDTKNTKINVYYFKYGKLISDDGWIFKTETKYHGFSLNNINPDFIAADMLPEEEKNMIFNSEIYFMREQDNYDRSYMKIQDLFAIVGGLIKISMLISSFIVNKISKLDIFINLSKKIYDLENNKKIVSRQYTFKNLVSNPSVILNNSNFKIIRLDSSEKNIRTHISTFKVLLNIMKCKRSNKINHIIEKTKETFDVYRYVNILNEISKLKIYLLNDFEQKCFMYLKKETLIDDNTSVYSKNSVKTQIRQKIESSSQTSKEKLLLNLVDENLIYEN